jgi:hypothetical protein
VQNSVEIWNAASAGRQTNVTPPGAVRDLALNSAMLVVLTIDAKGARVIRYDTHGAKLRSSESHSAPPTSPTRSATGSWNSTWLPATCVVYTRHSWPPTRVTISSGRVLWVAGGHRILSIPA